jgi:hypothetical protein
MIAQFLELVEHSVPEPIAYEKTPSFVWIYLPFGGIGRTGVGNDSLHF